MKDLFETPELIPQNVNEVLETFNESECSYKELSRILEAVESIGFTFEYYLDGTPYNLREI